MTVTADPQTKVYGDSRSGPDLPDHLGHRWPSPTSFTGALTRDAGEDVGQLCRSPQGTLALSANYDLSYVGDDLTITTRAVTVTADPQTKVYGDSDPALTYQITLGARWPSTDEFTGALTRDAGEDVGQLRHHPGHARPELQLRPDAMSATT